MKRPFLQFAIQKIESLFQKGKENSTLLRQIKNELEHRKSKRSKTLKNKIDAKIVITDFDNLDKEKAAAEAKVLEEKRIADEKAAAEVVAKEKAEAERAAQVKAAAEAKALEEKRIADEKSKAEATAERVAKVKLKSRKQAKVGLYEDEIDSTLGSTVKIGISEKSDIKLEDLLKSITLRDFVENDTVPVRVRNRIVAEADFIEFKTIYDFITSSEEDKQHLKRLPSFGQQSLDDLQMSIENFIKEKIDVDDFEHLFKGLIKQRKACNNKELKDSLNSIGVFDSIEQFINYAVSIIVSEKEQKVIKARYLSENIPTLQKVADKFGISKARVGQLQKKAIKRVGSFVLGFSKEDLFIDFKPEFDNYFFIDNCFVSKDSAKQALKQIPGSAKLFINSISGNLPDFLNNWYFYSSDFEGWFIKEDDIKNNTMDDDNLYIIPANTNLDINQAIRKSKWPITLSSIANIVHIPECVVQDKISVSKDLILIKTDNNIFIRPKKITRKDAVRYVLRKYERGMTLQEVKGHCLEMFNLELTKHIIGNTLNDLPDGLIIDTGTYALYEHLDMNIRQLTNIREFCNKYLLEKQKYISAFVIFNELKKKGNINETYGVLNNGHVLFGVCQDDNRFITKKGFMLGLSSNTFKGRHISLTQEMVDLMIREGRPLEIREIMEKLSSTRCLIAGSIFSMLNNNRQDIFERRGSAFYLANDEGHLEIDDEELLEHDFDDI